MEKVPLLGFDFWNAKNEEEAAQSLLSNASLYASDNVAFLITLNAFDIAQYHTKYKELYQKFKNAAVVLPDGMPIVWLSKLFAKSIKQRISGSNFFPVLWRKIKEEKKRAFFILSSQQMAEMFLKEYGACRYAIPDFFESSDEQYVTDFIQSHIEEIRSFRPDFIFIGITFPKQQNIALELYRNLSAKQDFNCMVAVLGASYEFYLGLKKRAPLFFQRSGTEWLYRFVQEPGRLWRRYTIGNIQFLCVAAKELLFYKKRSKLY